MILATLISFSSEAQTDIATRYANEIKNFALQGMIGARCERYLPLAKVSDCQRTVASMLKFIDSAMIFPSLEKAESLAIDPQSFIFIAFKTTLIDLLKKESTTKYLNDVLLKGRDENLWLMTLEHYPNPKIAAQVLAALFQDTSSAKLHIHYLQKTIKKPGAKFLENIDVLEHAIDLINQMLDTNPDHFKPLLFPPGTRTDLNRNIYHFYVPLFLGRALKDSGVNSEMSYIAPMLMTLTYEFVTASGDYRYIFSDPKTLDVTKHAWKIKDIYAGHQGASMAVGRKNVKTLETLRKGFQKSTLSTVKLLLF